MGGLYNTLVSRRFGAEYNQKPKFQERLAACRAHNSQLTTALIENSEGAQVVLETRNGIPGSTFEALENGIRRRSASVQCSYVTALASHHPFRAAEQIQAVEVAGGNAAELTFPHVQRKDARSKEAGTFFCGFEGCTNSGHGYKTLDGLVRHVKHEKRGYGRTGSASNAKAATHVGYTPDKADYMAEGRRSHQKKTWDIDRD
jgi:hypothetical protein